MEPDGDAQLLNVDEVIDQLREACMRTGSQAEFARRHKIRAGRVGDVLHGKCRPYRQILDALGLERVVYYERKRP